MIKKAALVLGTVATVALAAAQPAEARWRHGGGWGPGLIGGLAAGALIAGAASSAYAYGPGYGYYGPGYGYYAPRRYYRPAYYGYYGPRYYRPAYSGYYAPRPYYGGYRPWRGSYGYYGGGYYGGGPTISVGFGPGYYGGWGW